jgi:hypothetical protein
VIAATTDTDGEIGVVVGQAGTTGNAQIAIHGQAGCIFDGTPAAVGNFVTMSSTTAGDCHDTGAKTRTAATSQIIGEVLSTTAITGSTYPITVNPNGAPVGQLANQSDVTLTSPASGNLLAYNGSKWINETVSSAVTAATAPSFLVNNGSSTQTVSANTYTKMTLGTVSFDTISGWSTGNSRYTPTVAGYYILSGSVWCGPGGPTVCTISVYKNGSLFASGSQSNTSFTFDAVVATIVYLNGTSDYVELWGYTSGTALGNAATNTYFNGALLAPLASGSVAGTGTLNYVPKWSSSTNLTNSLIFDNGTSVGIGTGSPSWPLHVFAPTGSQAFVEVQNAGSAANDSAGLYLLGGSSNASWLILTNRANIAGNADSLAFYKNAGTTGAKLVIQDNGNIGIGTTSPGATFTVGNNTFEVTSAGAVTAASFTGSGSGLTSIGTSSLSATGTANSTKFLRGDNTWATVSGGGGGSGTVTSSPAGDMAYFQSTGTTVIGTSTLQIANNAVGIGTASPQSLLEAYGGEIQPGASSASCGANNAGALRWTNYHLRICDNNSAWQIIETSSAVTLGGNSNGITNNSQTEYILLTSGTSWTVPKDWNSSNNTIEAVGAGGAGNYNTGGGGGGAYAKITNLSLTAGNSITYQAGSAKDSYFNGSSCAAASICAKAASGITGGSASSSVGTIKYAGGNGTYSGYWTGGGGGAAGPHGAGNNASGNTGGSADAGFGGAAAANGTDYSYGLAGAGGGGNDYVCGTYSCSGSNPVGGLYGGGIGGGNGGTGTQGAILITYFP